MADRKSAGFCYDIATLLPLYNPMAVPIPDYVDPNTTSLSASPLSTVLVFGQPFGELTQFFQTTASPSPPPLLVYWHGMTATVSKSTISGRTVKHRHHSC